MKAPNSHNKPNHHHEPYPQRREYYREVPEYGYERGLREAPEDEIDLMEVALFFWDRRITIAKITGAFLIFGILIAMLSRVEYQASATLLPETQSPQSSASNLLRQYGGLLGVSGGGNIGGETISPSLYPDIVASLPYQVELMNEPVYFSTMDTTMTPHEYFREFYPPSAIDYIKKYTIGLPGQILNIFRGSKQETFQSQIVNKINRESVISLSGEQRSTIGKLRNSFTINQEEGLVTLTAEFPDPQAAAEIGLAGINLLKEFVREYRTQKANEELKFVREQVNEAKQRFEKAQLQLAEFRDSNVTLSTAKAQTREQELQSQYDLAFDLFNTLSQNLEQAKLRVQENTPVFTTVEPFQIPSGKSAPNTRLIILMYTFIGLFISILFVLGKKQWVNFKQHLVKN